MDASMTTVDQRPLPHVSRRTALQAGALGLLGLWDTAAPADERKPSPPRIRIGQIGVGHAHASKLSAYRDSPDYEVVGVVEPDDALRKRAEDEPAYRGLKWLTRDRLLETPGLQVVLVETRVKDLLDNADVHLPTGRCFSNHSTISPVTVRTPSGAVIFGSKVSCCGGPPN
jgi:hypothetical protein